MIMPDGTRDPESRHITYNVKFWAFGAFWRRQMSKVKHTKLTFLRPKTAKNKKTNHNYERNTLIGI